MHTSEVPPSLKSILATGQVNLSGPHQRITNSGSVHTFQTISTGALNSRLTNFFFCLNACTTLGALSGLLNSWPRIFGTICHDTPNLSLSQPQGPSLPPSV